MEPYDLESKNGSERPSWRVAVIVYDHLFPSEWRIADARTILPEELPGFYSKWKDHIHAVRSSKYRGYLLEWYLYLESMKAQPFWDE